METQLPTKTTVPKTILVGLDGSMGSARALDWSINLAKSLDAEIVAAHVAQMLSPAAVSFGIAPIELPLASLEDLRRRFEDEWAAALKAAGVRYRTVFETDAPPAPTLIAIAPGGARRPDRDREPRPGRFRRAAARERQPSARPARAGPGGGHPGGTQEGDGQCPNIERSRKGGGAVNLRNGFAAGRKML